MWKLVPLTPSEFNDRLREDMRSSRAQHYAITSQAQNNINAWQPIGDAVYWPPYRYMTAADLGIIDQNLDDKVGMEP